MLFKNRKGILIWKTKDEWMPNEYQRYGLSYGFDEVIDNNEKEINRLRTQMELEQEESINNVKLFVKEVEGFFKLGK